MAECGWFPENAREELEDIAVPILNEPFDEFRHPDLAAADFEPEDIGTRIEIGQLAPRNPRSRPRANYWYC